MSKNKNMQKLVPISRNKKDFSKIKDDLKDGWVIANMMPHGDGFLCVLEKNNETAPPAFINTNIINTRQKQKQYAKDLVTN